MIRLTDKEIMDVVLDEGLGVVADENTRAIAQAQLKKAWEWGNEPCDGEGHWGTVYIPPEPRRKCPDCWQALLEEVK